MARARSKYHSVPTVVQGILFDSKAEARRFEVLRALEDAGKIADLRLQPKFALEVNGRPLLIKSKGYPNGRKASFKLDFGYVDGGKQIYEDVKGGSATRTEAYQLRKAILEAMHPEIEIREVG